MRGMCEEHECEVDSSWVCDDHTPFWEVATDEIVENKALKAYTVDSSFVTKLQPIKMIGETRAAGYGCYFAKDKREKDVIGTRFTKATDLGEFYDKAPVLYHHGLTKAFGLDKIGKTAKAQIDDIGVWLEIEIDRSKAYWKKVKSAIESGLYYFSGGSAEHLIATADDGELKAFPVFEWSITTTPAEWRLGASKFYKSIGIDLEDEGDSDGDGTGAENARQKPEGQKPEVRNNSTAKDSTGVVTMELTPEQLTAQVQAAVKAAMDAQTAIQVKAAEEAEAKRKAEEAKQAEIKAAVDKAVAEVKASLPAIAEQRPGYGRFNVNFKPLGDGFSFSKAIRGIAMSTDNKPNAWSGAERERDIMMKYANEVRASLAEGVGNLGGYLVPPEYLQDQFIPLLRARAVVRQAGARTYPARSDTVYIPSQTGGATAAWYGENATLTASNLTFGQLIINIKKLGALEYVSNELLADGSPDADTLLKEDLANVIALKEDSTFLMSNGAAPTWANAPVGFAFYTGTSSVTPAAATADGGALAIGDLFKFKLALMKENVPFDTSMAWFCSPTTWDKIAQFKDAQNRYQLETLTGGNVSQYPAYGAYPEGPEGSVKGSVQGRIFGYPVYVTANITETNTYGSTTTATYMFFARMNDVFIAERAGLELMASNVAGTAFASDQTWVRGIMREGLGIRHAPAVVVGSGLTTA
jgi:HK97 family phage major capsid protein